MRERRNCSCPRVKHQHGTRRAWEADHCRCLPCRAAHANATRAYRNGGSWLEAYTPSIGTVRRLRALAAAGVTSTQIVAHTGLSRDMVGYLRRGRHQQVTHALAALVADAYDALWDAAAGDGDSRRCATIARTAGWLPPLAWDDDSIDDPAATPMFTADAIDTVDEVEVQRLMGGSLQAVPFADATPELLEAVRRLVGRGLSDREIGGRVGLKPDAVGAMRRRHGITTGRAAEARKVGTAA